MATKGIYRFGFDCGPMGSLAGVFIATDEEVSAAIGKRAYFGEVLGKHSEISGEIYDGHITLVTIDSLAVEIVEKHELTSGFNPLEYIDSDEDEDPDEDEE